MPTYVPERMYILDVLLNHFLGLEYRVVFENRSDWCLELDEAPEAGRLLLPDVLFQIHPSLWLTAAAMPREPLARAAGWNMGAQEFSPDVPILYGRQSAPQTVESTGKGTYLAFDLFGSAFYLLTRYEEAVDKAIYLYNRFPAAASLASRAGLINRPIINEYLELTWQAMRSLWPRLPRRQREFRLMLSHDVDLPFATGGRSLAAVLRNAAGDILKRRNPRLAWRRLLSHHAVASGQLSADPYWTFDFVMEVAEANCQTAVFYFLVDDTVYSLEDSRIVSLVRQIHQRGHLIGVHPTLGTYNNPQGVIQARGKVERLMQQAGVWQEELGGRQHFLQWSCPDTWEAYASARLCSDSTLAFFDRAGFRCGICYEYPVFNLRTRQALPLIEYPLIVMEKALFKYEGLPNGEALQRIEALKMVCQKYNGNFTLLWHNSLLYEDERRYMYQQAACA